MSKRVPGSIRTRQSPCDLIEGRLSPPDGRAELVRLATRLIVEETLEAESRDAVGRAYYEHGAAPGQGYHNGVRTERLKTAGELIEYAAPRSLLLATTHRSAGSVAASALPPASEVLAGMSGFALISTALPLAADADEAWS